jgi:hypothetical protein
MSKFERCDVLFIGWIFVVLCAIFIWNFIKGSRQAGLPPKRFHRSNHHSLYENEPISPRHNDGDIFETKEEVFWRVFNAGVLIERKRYLCNKTENEYHKRLTEWFGQCFDIHCQVAEGHLFIYADWSDVSDSDRKRFATICNTMVLDYVLVNKTSRMLYCAIELDGPAHEMSARIVRDKMLNAIMGRINIPLLHTPVSRMNEKPDIWKFKKKEQAAPEHIYS